MYQAAGLNLLIQMRKFKQGDSLNHQVLTPIPNDDDEYDTHCPSPKLHNNQPQYGDDDDDEYEDRDDDNDNNDDDDKDHDKTCTV